MLYLNYIYWYFSKLSLLNGLSNHGAQIIVINDIQLQTHNCQIQTIRKINKRTMNELIIKLIYETLDNIFDSNYTDSLLLPWLIGCQITVPSF